MPKILEESSSG